MNHREGSTGDTVQLNMLHGNHYQSGGLDAFPIGKTWGPWLWYLVSLYTILAQMFVKWLREHRMMALLAMQR
jgi:hypothetical protein